MPSTCSRNLENADGNELDVLPSGRLPDEEAQIEGHSTLTGAQLQNYSDAQELPTNTSRDERQSLHEGLKAEKGFDSYIDFLGAYEEGRPYVTISKKPSHGPTPNLIQILPGAPYMMSTKEIVQISR